MCRIMTVIGVKKNHHLLEEVLVSAEPIMTKDGKNDDGAGYTLVSKRGFHTCKWTDNKKFYTSEPKLPQMLQKELRSMVKKPETNDRFQQGPIPNWEDVSSMLIHTRKATCALGIENTHPFVTPDNKISLIHNGSITNSYKFDKELGTCDSESILTLYRNNDVRNNLANSQVMFDELVGNYAVVVASYDSKNRQIIDVFRNNGYGTLYIAHSKLFDCWIIATRKDNILDLEASLNPEIKLGLSVILPVNNHVVTRFDSISGKVIEQVQAAEKTYTYGSHNTNYYAPATTPTATVSKEHWKFDETTGGYYRSGEDQKPIAEVVPLKGEIVEEEEVIANEDLKQFLTQQEIEELDAVAAELTAEERAILEAFQSEDDKYEWLMDKAGWYFHR